MARGLNSGLIFDVGVTACACNQGLTLRDWGFVGFLETACYTVGDSLSPTGLYPAHLRVRAKAPIK